MIQTLELNHLKANQEILLIVVFGILSLGIIFVSSIETVSAENNIRQIIKIDAIYPANVASADFFIDPPLFNLSKSFAFITYSHTGEDDHSDTWRSYEFIDKNTLRIKGENTATGNLAVSFVAYIVEYENTSTMFSQEILGNVTIATGGTINFTIPIPINITSSMLVSQGHHANFSETSVGNEEIERHRILDSTTWEYFVTNDINTEPQGNIVSVIDWSQSDISVQRGIGSIDALDDLPATVSPPTDVDRSRTILLVTNAHDGLLSQDPDDFMIRATLDATVPPNIIISRDGGKEGRLDFAWEVIEFPANMIKVHYDTVTILGGIPAELTKTDIIPEVKDYSKTVVISTVGQPFGWGSGSSGSGNEGAIDTAMQDIRLQNNTAVQFTRGDSADDAIIDYMVIQFLEKDFAQNAQGTNGLSQIVKIEGQYTGATPSQDFTITPALSNVSKSMLFMSFSDNSSSTDVTPNVLKRYSIIDTSTLRISGNNDPSLTNNAINFTAIIVEMNSTSPIFVQRDQSQHPDSIQQVNAELKMHISPVNTTNSFIQYNGMSATGVGTDTTMGFEEIRRVRIINGSSWGWNFENPDNTDSHVGVVNVNDWNQNNISVQRSQATLSGTTLSVSPATDVIRNQTLLFVTHRTSNAEATDEPDDAGLLAHLDGSVPPNIVFERIDGTDAPLEINWELISFPADFVFIEHLRHNQTAGTSNATEAITPVSDLARSFAIGTASSYGIGGYSGGKGTLSTVDVDTFGEIVGKITLESAGTVRFERGLSVGSWELGFQVVEFLSAGAVFNQTVTDTTTNIDDTRFITNKTEADSTSGSDQIEFETNKTAIDFTVTVDAGQGFNITKAFSDIVVNLDQVNLQKIFNQIITDISTSLDQVQFEIDKIAVDTTTNLEETGFNITKAVVDIVVNLDTVNINVIFNQIVTDISTSLDQVGFEINKTAVDFTVTVDAGQNMNITKSFTDIVVNIDQVNLQVIIEQIITDITTSLDEVRLTITKNVIDFVTNAETVETGLTLFQNASDTTTNSDQVNLIVQLKPVIPSGGGAPSSGGIDPVGLPLSPVRLIGLNIASEVLVVERGDIETSEFAISWFGDDFEGIKLTSIEAKDDFVGFNQWFAFSPTPDQLDVSHEIGFDNRLPTDPRSQFNTALDDYVLNVPRNDCTGTLVSVVTANCFNPIVYEVPLTFEFELKGATFKVDHIVQIDARDRPKCVILDTELPMQACDVVDFTLEFWWLLALIALVVIAIPKFIIPAGKRKVRVAHFVRGRNDDLLGDDPTSKRLKRLKKVR